MCESGRRSPLGRGHTSVSTALPREGRICLVASDFRNRMDQRQRRRHRRFDRGGSCAWSTRTAHSPPAGPSPPVAAAHLVSRRLDLPYALSGAGRRPETGHLRDSRRSVTVSRPCRADRNPSRDQRPQPLLLAVTGLQPLHRLRSRAKALRVSVCRYGQAGGRRSFRDPMQAPDLARVFVHLTVHRHADRFLSVGPMTQSGSQEPPRAC